MLSTVWQGLVSKPNLTHLTIRFPSRRTPQPIAVVPPLPNLRSLKLYDIDPLCYGDDVSLLIRDSKKLEDLTLIWNPRMREVREPSVSLSSFFASTINGGVGPPIRRLALKNLYVINDAPFAELVMKPKLEELTFINSVAGAGDDADSVFFEPTWRPPTVCPVPNLKVVRTDKVTRQQMVFMSSSFGLESLYLVGPPRTHGKTTNGFLSKSPATLAPYSPASSTNSPPSDAATINLKEEYLSVIIKHHGPTLRHLLLSPYWRLTLDEIALIVRHCPNLEQLAIGVESCIFFRWRLLVPFLSKLTAVRLLDHPDDPNFLNQMKELEEDESYAEQLGSATQSSDWSVKWMGFGDALFEFGKMEEHFVESEEGPVKVGRRRVWKRPISAGQYVEIFGLDSYEI